MKTADLHLNIQRLTKKCEENMQVCANLEKSFVRKYKEAAEEEDSIKRKQLLVTAKGIETESNKLKRHITSWEEKLNTLKKQKKDL